MNRWFSDRRWSKGRFAGYRWDRSYGVDWANFTGDPLALYNGGLPDPRIWEEIRNDQGLAKGLSGKLNYDFPGDNVNYFSRWRLNGYYPANLDFEIIIWFFDFSSARPVGVLSDRNYGPKMELRDYGTGYSYRGLVGRCFDPAYNGYISDSDTIGAREFNFSPETAGRIKLERIGDSLFASRWRMPSGPWLWNVSPPTEIRTGVQSMELAIEFWFEGENNARISSNAYNFQCTPGLVEREDL